MNSATSYAPSSDSSNWESARTVLLELFAAMPIVIFTKALRGALKTR